ncbi:MAG TPA: hypothetical protein VMU47_14310 [Caldimonas sp.]|nr:hypothetical protein [Caldimonas sp.]
MPHFVVMGWFRPGADAAVVPLQPQLNDQLAYRPLRLAGLMRDADGRPRGWIGVLEGDSIDAARTFLEHSPYLQSGLYERAEIYAYSIEVGRLD